MQRIISGRFLRPGTFLLQLVLWFQANWETRKSNSQKSLWGKSCTWVVGVPIDGYSRLNNSSKKRKKSAKEGDLFFEWASEFRWNFFEWRKIYTYKTSCTRHGRFWWVILVVLWAWNLWQIDNQSIFVARM